MNWKRVRENLVAALALVVILIAAGLVVLAVTTGAGSPKRQCLDNGGQWTSRNFNQWDGYCIEQPASREQTSK